MVAQQKRAVSSSDEGGLLIDDLIEWIETQIDADPQMREVRRAHPAPERIPAQVALGYFLPYPVTPRVDFDTGKLLRERESLGWDLVRARARHGNRSHLARPPPGRRPRLPLRGGAVGDLPPPSAPGGGALRRHAAGAVPAPPGALVHGAERSSHVERVIHTLLDRSARGLGRLGSAVEKRACRRLSTLLVDNYDSYTYNVFHLLAAACGEEPIVVHNDMVSWRAL